MQIIRDERGFLHIYLLSIFATGCVVFFFMMLATFAGVMKNATATYSWLEEAGDFTAHTADANDLVSSSYEDVSQVETVFENNFGGMTNTNFSGSSFNPATGSPFPAPVDLTAFEYYSQGEQLPDGSTAGEAGYWISVSVPILVAKFPYYDLPITIQMHYYAEL